MNNKRRIHFYSLFFLYIPVVQAMEHLSLYDHWTIIAHSSSEELEKQKQWALQWAVKHGQPKVIKKLAEKDLREKKLKKARKKFVQQHGKYSLEQALMQNYLNMVKDILSKADLLFKAETFALAAQHGKIKITRYLAQENPNLFTMNTLYILYNLFKTTIHDKSLRPIKTVLQSNIIFEQKQLAKLLEFGIQESKEVEFTECYRFLESELSILRYEPLTLKPVFKTI